jgi:hypothetical protein
MKPDSHWWERLPTRRRRLAKAAFILAAETCGYFSADELIDLPLIADRYGTGDLEQRAATGFKGVSLPLLEEGHPWAFLYAPEEQPPELGPPLAYLRPHLLRLRPG